MRYAAATAIVFAALMAVQSNAQTTPEPAPLLTVEKVDLTRYAGKWYEIALLPNRFQAQCISDTNATYVQLADGTIEVTNRCRLQDGTTESIVGAARSAKGDVTGAKLQVRFAPWYLSFLPMVWGNYWVTELDADYKYAVVSEPSKKFLWVLSRTPKLDEATYEGILKRLSAKGFDVSKIAKTPQTAS